MCNTLGISLYDVVLSEKKHSERLKLQPSVKAKGYQAAVRTAGFYFFIAAHTKAQKLQKTCNLYNLQICFFYVDKAFAL